MLENKNIVIGLVIAFIVYLLIKSLSRKDKGFEKEYKEILNSDRHKVKGQY